MALIDRVLDSSSHQLQKKALISFTPVSERIATIRLKESVSNLTIIHVYTLDSTRSDEECEQFYFQLQSVTDQTPKKDMLIVMGDFNTITGNDPIDPRDVMGPHGHGRLNGRGERLISFCRENDLYITNNAFKHRHRRKVTWRSHDGVTENMIDHVLISKRWKSSIMDTVSLPGKDFDSDHSLLMSKLKLRLKRLPKTKRIPRFRTELLRDPIKKASIPTQPPFWVNTKLASDLDDRPLTKSSPFVSSWNALSSSTETYIISLMTFGKPSI
ncbi:craniofacial development protein 2-like [Artemia franciscana]|uniref:craniofacial development protein 2-like n=1 Tax=Artemia franciscana TaxID=6661 RepID=UPI0032DA5AB8